MRPSRSLAIGGTVAAAALAGCTLSSSDIPDTVPEVAVAYTEGDADAPVHVIYFADYVCEDCARFSRQAGLPLKRGWLDTGRARLTVVDVAWHRGSLAASAAATCAADQGKYWEMHELLFTRQESWKRAIDIPAALQSYAVELQLDADTFARCTAKPSHQVRITAAEEMTKRYAVRGTPAFVVNGRLYYGSQEWRWLDQVLAANERGAPDEAPAPPMRIPTRQVVDSVRLRALQDSLARAGDGAPAAAAQAAAGVATPPPRR